MHSPRRIVTTLTLLIAAATLALLPTGDRVVGNHPSFMPAFFSCIVLLDVLSSWLLVQQFLANGRLRSLLFAACYGWSVASLIPHILVFPGVITPTGLLGSAPSSTPWLWTSWHTGFALLLAVAALPVRALDRRREEHQRTRDIALAAGLIVVVAGLVAWVMIAGSRYLPDIITGNDYSRLLHTGGPYVIGVSACALVLTWRHASRCSDLDRWFVVVAAATLGDVLLTLFAAARYTVGWYGARALALFASATVMLAMVGQLTQIYRQLSVSAVKLQQLAETDELTGLPNRRAVLNLGRALVGHTEPFCVAMVDIDLFKDVNDTLGHDAGDQVLFVVAGRMSETLRSEDHVGRYGGEEFLVLLPHTDLNGACAALEAVRLAVSRAAVVTSTGTITPTVSVGVTQLRPGQDLAAAISAADRALYQAKDAGRNRVVPAGGRDLPTPDDIQQQSLLTP
ncbi:MAG: putative transrane protein [Frankiales bacterium]|nr:putative transrane protein [Frankiales bacterium]